MTYADIKNQYKTVEEIDNRINAINSIFDERDKEIDEMETKDMATLNDILKPILPEDWEVTSYSPSNSLQIANKNDVFHSIYIYAKYDIDFKTEDYKEVWEFSMNPCSCGQFEIFGNSDAKMYYKVIGILMTNEDIMHTLNDTLRSMADNYKEFRKKNRDLRSEQKQLEILKKSIEEEKESTEYVEAAKNADDKRQLIIINKKANAEKSVGTHRGTPITVHSLPQPNESYEDLMKTCKMMNKKDKEARYIATEIRYVKFS